MANIDITDLLVDPDFVDQLSLITRKPSVNSYGENYLEETTLDSVGSIQPADYKTLMRLPEALQKEDVSSFWFKGEIIATADCRYPSLLVFRGKRYQVRQIADWTNWGQGWCEGICVAEKPS